jgi:hypothetical protein
MTLYVQKCAISVLFLTFCHNDEGLFTCVLSLMIG